MEIQIIQNKIYEIRGQRVMLDFDLAEIYGVETKVLNQSVKRNIKRFPSDFMFQLTKEETDLYLKSQIVTSSSRSQFVTLNKRGTNVKYLPYAFTEHGVTMLSGILRSDTAIQANIQIVRAFISLRQYVLEHSQTNLDLNELKKQLLFLQEDVASLSKDHENYEQHFDDIYLALAELASKNKEKDKISLPKVGFIK